MTDQKTLMDTLEATLQRGNPAYTSPSGAFLALLQKYADEGKLNEMARANALYAGAVPQAKEFIRARVPGILVNRYLPLLAGLDFDSFIRWSVETPSWAGEIREAFDDEETLCAAVQRVVEKVAAFKQGQVA